MMQCELCHNTEGPFEVAEIARYYDDEPHLKLKLVCEDCGKKLREERKKKDDTTHICNKGHVDRISRSNSRS